MTLGGLRGAMLAVGADGKEAPSGTGFPCKVNALPAAGARRSAVIRLGGQMPDRSGAPSGTSASRNADVLPKATIATMTASRSRENAAPSGGKLPIRGCKVMPAMAV